MNKISYQNLIMLSASVPNYDKHKEEESNNLFDILGKAQKNEKKV